MRFWSFMGALVLAAGITLGPPGPADAHHIRGLPHYGYAENYPQNPTYEVQGFDSPFRVYLSAFEIYDTKEVDIAVYVFNEETNEAYTGPLTMSVSDGNTTTSGTGVLDVSNTYHVRWVYETGGIYQVEATFYIGGETRRVTLPLKVGSSGRWWTTGMSLAGVAAGLVIFLLVVARIKGRRAGTRTSHKAALKSPPEWGSAERESV